MGDSDEAEDRARVHWSVPPPPPGAPVPETSAAALGEEFLFHLYRGSELLQEDQIYEAKSELERALSFQPKDVEGQSLLGVTYFRLGHYPRAIQIYEELVRDQPTEVAPRVNLGLCYLKTGQLALARSLLEELVQHKPEHARAWGYLGLSYQRLGDYEKAAVAFDRAGRPALAARLRAGSSSESVDPGHEGAPSSVQEITQDQVRAAKTLPPPPGAGDGPRGSTPPPASRRVGSMAPGTRVSIPAPLDRVARESILVFPERPRVALHETGVVLARIEGSFNARSDCLRALAPSSVGRPGAASQTSRSAGRPRRSSRSRGEGGSCSRCPRPFSPWCPRSTASPSTSARSG